MEHGGQADHEQGGQTGTAHDMTVAQREWDDANRLQGLVRVAERTHGFRSREAIDLHRQASDARERALAAGYRSSYQGKVKGLDRRGGPNW